MRNNLRIILAIKRKSIADVAKATGLSKYTLTQLYYERTKNPETQTLLKIVNYLDVTLDDLLDVEKYKEIAQS